ncbi:MAG: hypothetical protein HYW13_04685 [Planctomycetes bacterium]|nr:hypothetical protein [Planctomycetota bacterium]
MLFFATVMELVLIFVRRTAAMCFTISLIFAATLMFFARKFTGFSKRIYWYARAEKSEAHDD